MKQNLPHVISLRTSLGSNVKVIIYYNIRKRRMDIEFWRQDEELPIVKICFESGGPVQISREEYEKYRI